MTCLMPRREWLAGSRPVSVGLTAFLLIPEDRVQQQSGPRDTPWGLTGRRAADAARLL